MIDKIRPHIEYLKANNIYMAENLVNAILKDVDE